MLIQEILIFCFAKGFFSPILHTLLALSLKYNRLLKMVIRKVHKTFYQLTLAPSEGEAHLEGSVNSDTSSSATSLYEVVPLALTFSQTFMEKWRKPLPPFSLFLRLLKKKLIKKCRHHYTVLLDSYDQMALVRSVCEHVHFVDSCSLNKLNYAHIITFINLSILACGSFYTLCPIFFSTWNWHDHCYILTGFIQQETKKYLLFNSIVKVKVMSFPSTTVI